MLKDQKWSIELNTLLLTMKISGIVEESIVDGPGIRFTIFTQGCSHNCYKCHNPHTHDINKGSDISINELILKIGEVPYIDGVTLSGGDPLMQIDECLQLCKKIKEVLKIIYEFMLDILSEVIIIFEFCL